MKLHRVRLENLNSLYDEHVIDFDKDLNRASLFLILGPTGSGKSTILDAICLALFAQTPRLSVSRGRAETDARHIMSYGTGRCLAEITFSKRTHEGTRRTFRATWECRRARENPSGNLQDPERSLVEIMPDGEEVVLATGKRVKDTKEAFEEVLEQMTVEEFRRSILLAQGDFAAFLQASEQDKASILERLTSTDQYKVIGQRAAAKRREVFQARQRLLDRLDGVELLEPEEEEALKVTIAELEAESEAARGRVERARLVGEWIAKGAALLKQIEAGTQRVDAARAALDARAEDLERLQEDERCQPAEKPLNDWEHASMELERLKKAQPELEQKLAAAAEALQAAEAALAAAREDHQSAREARDAARPTIEQAQLISARATASGEEAARQQAAIDTLKAAHAEADQAQAKAREVAEAARAEQAAAAEAHDATQSAHGLVSQWEALAAQTRRLADDEAALVALREEVTTTQEAIEAITREITALQAQIEAARGDDSPALARLTEAQAALTAALAGAADVPARRAQLTAQADSLRERLATIDAAMQAHDALVKQTAQIVQQRQEFISRDAHLAQLHDRLSARHSEVTRVEELRAEQARSLQTLGDMLDLVARRRELTDGDACPLCGSHDHPWTHDHDLSQRDAQLLEDRDRLQKRIDRTDEDLRSLHAEIQQTTVQIEAHKLHLKSHDAAAEALTSARDAALAQHNTARLQLDLHALSVFPEDEAAQGQVRAQLQGVRDAQAEQLDARVAAARALDTLRDAVAAAESAVSKERERVAELEQRLTARAEAQAARQQELERQQTRAQEAETAHAARSKQLAQRFVDVGFDPDGYDSFADALDATRQARDAFVAARERFEQAREARSVAEEALRQLEREHAGFADKLAALEDALSKATAQHTAAQAELRALLGDRELDAWRAALEQAVTDAEAAITTTQETLTSARTTHAEQAALVEDRRKSIETRTETLVEQRHELDLKLDALFLTNHDELKAKLLPAEERHALRTELEALRRERELARASLKEAQAQHTSHTEAAPQLHDDEPKLDDAHGWDERTSALSAARDETVATLGAQRQRLASQEEARARAAEFKDQLDALGEQLRVWDTISKLIGRNDGDSFKQFAQSLNLGELVDRANTRLRRLAPRYALAVAVGENREPLLNFAVRDRHQANFERPLTTLSGGETFLVSLALALALSDFRRMEMPVETLLLDEGFGTLDQETLDVAMSTLRHLQQESDQQIGLISHVEALKERIDTRILVEKLGNGRSHISIMRGDQLVS